MHGVSRTAGTKDKIAGRKQPQSLGAEIPRGALHEPLVWCDQGRELPSRCSDYPMLWKTKTKLYVVLFEAITRCITRLPVGLLWGQVWSFHLVILLNVLSVPWLWARVIYRSCLHSQPQKRKSFLIFSVQTKNNPETQGFEYRLENDG